MQNSSSHQKPVRTNTALANLHQNASKLLRRLAEGDVRPNDRAMARVYADELDKRRSS